MTKTVTKTARAAKPAAQPVAEDKPARNSKKVLSERDFLKPGQKTQKEQEAELRRELQKERAEIAKKQPVGLAKGLETDTMARNCRARMQDERAKAKASAKTEPKSTPKAAASRPGKTKADTTAKLTILVKAKDSGLKPGSDRFLRLQAIEKCKTLADALAMTIDGGKRIAMDNIRGMEKRGHVAIG